MTKNVTYAIGGLAFASWEVFRPWFSVWTGAFPQFNSLEYAYYEA